MGPPTGVRAALRALAPGRSERIGVAGAGSVRRRSPTVCPPSEVESPMTQVSGAQPRFVGIQPSFPSFLARWAWLNDPVPAERTAALRIATALALLLDIGLGCLPQFWSLFTADGLAGRDAYPWRFRSGHYY